MKNNGSNPIRPATCLPKCPTGIQGLDEITGGGLPRGRPTLVCGGAGCGKTLLAADCAVVRAGFWTLLEASLISSSMRRLRKFLQVRLLFCFTRVHIRMLTNEN